MSLIDLLRAKYQHHDPDVRLAAVKKLDDMPLLAEIAKHDLSNKVRNEAVSRITDESLLEQIVMQDKWQEVALSALKKINHDETIFLIAINAKDLAIRNAAIECIKSEKFLVEVLKSCDCLSTCISATKRITDLSLLEDIVIHSSLNSQMLPAIKDRIKHLTEDALKKPNPSKK